MSNTHPTDPKTKAIHDRLEQARLAAELAKAVTPDIVDKQIDKGVEVIEIADAGVSLFSKIASMFKKKK